MSKQAGMGTGPALGVAGAVAVVLGGLLYVTGVIGPAREDAAQGQTEPATLLQAEPAAEASESVEIAAIEPQPEESEPGVTEENSETAGEAESAAEAETDSADTTEMAADVPDQITPRTPSIDTFRLEPDGTMLVAGQAHPGWDTMVVLDGAELAQVETDATGQFVSFLSVERSDQPRILSLLSRDPNGEAEIASLDEIIITPSAPVVAAEVAAETAQNAEATETASVEETTDDDAAPVTAASETAAEPADATETETDLVARADPAEAEADAQPVQALIAEPAQTVLLSNEDGVNVIQPAQPLSSAPEVMSTVALDSITYSEEGEVQLTGRGQGEGFVRIYLDNAQLITSPISGDGNWRTDLPEVDTGVYTLRIDETDAQGNVTSRVETPFKREDEEVISEASEAVQTQKIKAVTVQPGSTLWAISRERYGEGVLYVRVFEANRDRIRDPDLIYPGQVLNLPE